MLLSRLYHLKEIAAIGAGRLERDKPQLIFGLGTCGIAAGGMQLKEFAKEYLAEKKIDAEISSVGCIGMCYAEPLVDVKIPGKPRVTYGKMTVEKLKEVIDTHLVGGVPLKKYALAQLNSEISECTSTTVNYSESYEGIPAYQDLPFFAKQVRIVLRNCGIIDPEEITEYIARGGYRSAYKVLHEMKPEEVIEEIKASGLRGRGGAGFPTGLKWDFCHKARGDVKYVICNADEGDPGAYMDRAVLEGDPHSVIEGMIIGAYAMGATEGYIYVRAEYPLAIERLRIALKQAEEYGILGTRILGTDFSFRIHIREGAGVFVCGEETALINSIEGRRGEPRPRPPFPATSGLWGKPTNINNVETWANIAMIIQRGSKWFSSFGTGKSLGTKVFSLVGKINRAGLIEVPMGIPMKDIVYEIGGGVPNDKKLKAVQTGGPSGGCIPAEHLDIPVGYEELKELGAIVGSGGMVVMDEDTCMVDVARYFLTFTSEESCGKCTPCRVGTKRMLEILNRICTGHGTIRDIETLESLSAQIINAALCGLGQTAPNPVMTTLRYFRNEYLEHVQDRRCSASVCAALFKAPCQNTCPAGTNVFGYIQMLYDGRFAEAYEINRENNPFPAICGRVCEHPCESRCLRGQLDEPIAIRELKRYCADKTFESGLPSHVSRLGSVDKKIAIVGGGPSGLSAAYFLERLGYSTTIYESSDELGGWMRYGIPQYRLPHEILDREINDIVNLGVEVKCRTAVGKDIRLEELVDRYDAVYLAVGAQKDITLGLGGEEGLIPGLKLLRDITMGKTIDVGNNVLVIGGGNVAIDVARSLVRAGVNKVQICYRREEKDMPAYVDEVRQCKEEGVEFHFLIAPESLIIEEGKVVGVRFRKNRIGAYTKWGRRQPEPTDDTIEIRADSVVVAIGQQIDDEFAGDMRDKLFERNRIKVINNKLETACDRIFAGGDAVLGPASVIQAIAHGKCAARSIDIRLSGRDRFVELEELNNRSYAMASRENDHFIPRETVKELPPDARINGFDEVVLRFDDASAKREAFRCLRCDLSSEEVE